MKRVEIKEKKQHKDPQWRLTIDIPLEDHNDLQEWCRELGAAVGKPRVPVSKVVKAMLRRAMTDQEWKDIIEDDVLDTW